MTDFRTLVNLRFTHAAALARAINTLKSHDVFGGIAATESNARDIAISFLSEILSGKCPVVPEAINSTEGIAHRKDINFVDGENACIEAFQTIVMGHATRQQLRRDYLALDLESNKDINDLLWDKSLGQPDSGASLQYSANHKSSCTCQDCIQ